MDAAQINAITLVPVGTPIPLTLSDAQGRVPLTGGQPEGRRYRGRTIVNEERVERLGGRDGDDDSVPKFKGYKPEDLDPDENAADLGKVVSATEQAGLVNR